MKTTNVKTIIAAILLCLTANSAYADGHWGGWHGGGWHGGGWRGEGWRGEGWRGGWGGEGIGWVAPALLGGMLGYALAQPQPIYVQPQPVYIQPPQEAYYGPPPQPVYRQVIEYNPACNCNVQVLRQVGWR